MLARTMPTDASVTFEPRIARALGLPKAVACQHDTTELVCPACSGPVDPGTRACARCGAVGAPIRRCVDCKKDVTAFWPYRDPDAPARSTRTTGARA